jgi:hypothetical protein
VSKKSRIKLPKRIAGLKIPKVVRKGPVMDFVNSSAGQRLLAEGLMAAAGLFAVKSAAGTTAGDAVRHPVDTVKEAGSRLSGHGADTQASIKRNSARLQFAFGEAARAFRAALAEPDDAASAEPEGAKKKQNSQPGEASPH